MPKTATKESPPRRRRPARGPVEAAAPRKAARKARRSGAEEMERGPRRALYAGSALLLFGLAMVGVDTSTEGAVVTLIGVLVLIYGIHTFGRLGTDEPSEQARA